MAQMKMASAPESVELPLRPELAVLAADVAIERAPIAASLGCQSAGRSIIIDSRLAEPGTTVVAHFALERALWSRLDPRAAPAVRAAHLLAAAHATASFIRLHPRAEAAVMRAAAPPALTQLMDAATASEASSDLAALLAVEFTRADEVPGAAEAWSAFVALRPIALSAVALMLRDGDNRLDLDPVSGCNRYGGSPLPRTDVIEFSSSTAADVSPLALGAAETLRQNLMATAARGRIDAELRAGAARIRSELLAALDIDQDGTVIPVLAASGTTAMLLATHIAAGRDSRPTLALVIGPDETGRGVPAAVVGRHPAPRTPTGAAVQQNGIVRGMPNDMQVARLAIRNGQGRPLAPESLAEPIAGIVARERSTGRRVILHVVEGSKTGLVAPGIASVLSLRRWFPDLPIVVDACQLRSGSTVLRRYLAAGCMVVLTGSKFMGGPPFSGALLVPPMLMDAMAPLPAGLADYSWRDDWPAAADDTRFAALSGAGNAGLLLRWRGALAEMSAFAALPNAKIAVLLDEIGRAVRAALLTKSDFVPLPAVPAVGADSEPWTGRASIFTFAMRPTSGGGWLDEAALRRLHVLLGTDVSDRLPAAADVERRRLAARICHIGQPVAFASGPHPAGLRIAIGARRIVAAARSGGMDELKRDLEEVVAKLSLVLRLET